MIKKYFSIRLFSLFAAIILISGCTKLDEKVYNSILQEDFLQTKADVYRDFTRAFEHGYWTIQANQQGSPPVINELTADHMMTPKRGGDWFDGGVYYQAHYHTFGPVHPVGQEMWNALFRGIMQATNSMEDIQKIDPVKFGMTKAEADELVAELRTLRAWFYLRLFDFYRNIPIVTAIDLTTNQSPPQVPPAEAFAFIEKELKEVIPSLFTRAQFGATAAAAATNGSGRWTKAAAASLLVRLYLNAKVYIGQDKYVECAAVCQDIIDGKYGAVALESRWDAPFDYTNYASPEVIFGFPSTLAQTHWHFTGGMYSWVAPYGSEAYFQVVPPNPLGGFNPRFALQPGRDVDSVEYPFQLGKPYIKFQKYPDDFRLKMYRNLTSNTREGMFLFGYMDYKDAQGNTKLLMNPADGGPYFLRDQVGQFKNTPPGTPIANKVSDMANADHNSGIRVIKYPFYPDPGGSGNPANFIASYAEIRLAEIYYTLAECKYRAGEKGAAAVLLNTVRKRNYPVGSPSLYNPDGSQLTDQEMLDEWGREFLFENRRRIDLIRWGVYNTGTWWDKQPDADDHTKILPIHTNVLNAQAGVIKQNPGYN
jgi:hypothetical protein